MKIKDLEKKIKDDANNFKLKDDYKKIKSTPIRKLKDGVNPVKFFNKNLALFVLVLILVLIFALSVAIFAFRLNNSEYFIPFNSFISITIVNDNTTQDYKIVCNTNAIVLAMYDEDKNIEIEIDDNKNLAKILSTIQISENDIVSLSVQNDSSGYATQIFKIAENEIINFNLNIDFVFNREINNMENKKTLVASINQKYGSIIANNKMTIDQLCSLFVDIPPKYANN